MSSRDGGFFFWNEGRREKWLVATAKCNSSQSPTDWWRPAWFGALSSSLYLRGATRQQLSWWCAGILGKRAKGYQVHGARRRQHHHRHVRVTCPGSPARPCQFIGQSNQTAHPRSLATRERSSLSVCRHRCLVFNQTSWVPRERSNISVTSKDGDDDD